MAKKVYRGTLKPEHQTGKGRVWPLSFSESSDISSIYSSTPNMGGANFETGASVGEYYLSIQKPLELGSGEGDMLLSELLADLEFTNRDPKVEGITDEEIQKVFNYLINRQTGKVKAGRFKYEIDDYEGDYEAELSFLSPRSDLHEMRDMIEYGSGYDEIMGIAEDLRVDTFALADTPTVMRVAKRLGYDGFVHRDQFAGVEAGRPLLGKHDIEGIEYNLSGFRDGGYEDQHLTWRPFSADQVRSVTGRRHAKDMGGGSRKGRTKKVLKEQDIVMELKLSELGLMDRLNRGFADKYLPIKKLQEELLKINPELPPDQMVETIVRLMAGKIARRSELIENLYEKPIIALAREHGLDYDELNLYIYAKHVKEGNEWLEEQAKQTERHLEAAEMAKLNGDKLEQKKQEKLAKAIGVKPGATVGMDTEIALGEVREYEKANPVALEIAKLVQKMNVESREGMVRDGLISQETADMWAGLFDWYVPTKTAQDGKSDFARSVGLSVPGADVMRRRGRTTIPDNVISMSLNQAQHMARRGETNQVGRALYKVLDQNGLIASKEEWSERHTQDGLTEEELVLKFDGVDHVIVLTDKDLADAMKHLNQAQMGKITTQIVKAMRMWSSLITQFSPGFMATNMPRDIQAALVTSLDVDQEGLQMRIAKNVRGAAAASWRVERGKPRKNEMDDWVIEFRDEGGMTGWSYNHGFAETDKDIQQRIQAGKPGQFVRGMFEYLGDINSALEGATRVSVYKALREGGMSKPEAAKYAREVTVDFNRGGEHSRTMNTAFLFFNAGVQGNLRFARAVASSSKVQAMVMGMIFGGGLQDEWLRNSAPKDKFGNNTYDQIPDYVKDHNWIIWNPFTESYLKIPMPYAYNLPLVIGRRMNAVRRDAMTEGEAFGAIFKAGLETFSPWQGANLYQAFTPSLLRPISEAAMNENFAGIPISRTKYPGQSTADSHSGRESTMAPWKMVAQAMNAVSGGDEWDSGWLDFSPESYAHVAEQFVGGFGKFIVRTGKATANIAQGRDVRMNDMPVVRRYFGERTPFGASATFYDIRDELSQSKKRITDLEERGEKKLAREWKRHDRALLSLDARWKATNKTVRKLRQERDNVDGYDKKKSLTDRIDRAMARFKREADKRILTP
ncbi:MAG: hypothetical protein OSB57_12960 [Planctomycetota bacterium]|nr:hypothetical protein [Planctomycetota bacterium]